MTGREEDGARRASPESGAGKTSEIGPREDDARRALLQRRLRSFAKTLAIVELGCIVLALVVLLVTPSPSVDREPDPLDLLVSLAGPAIFVAVWISSTLHQFRYRTLRVIDLLGTVAVAATFTLLGFLTDSIETAFQPVGYLLLLRSASIPSSGRDTFLVSVSAFVPSLLSLPFLLEAGATFPDPAVPGSPVLFAVRVALWIAIPTVISRVIYGLEEEVQSARQLGQYTLERKIGQGGMGQVYKARHVLLRRETAVKLIRTDRTDANTLARFEREVKATSQLTHPNTVSVYDYGRTRDGTFYYAMEFLEGIDLGRLVRRFGPQPPGRVVHMVSQACDSLEEAHAKSLVHRDVKPENLILCERGGIYDFVKVLDFGLARVLDNPDEPSLTETDVVLGSAYYLSPEALRSPKDVDARSDIYALGAVAYFLLAGTPPFSGSNIVEISVRQLSTEPPRPSEILGGPLPEDLEEVVLQCLLADPRERPQTTGELREKLGRSREAGTWTQQQARAWWKANTPELG